MTTRQKLKRDAETKRQIEALPKIEIAMARVQDAADRSMLPQLPYADFVPGIGWVIDSACNEAYIPVGGDRLIHQYPVMVVPARFWA